MNKPVEIIVVGYGPKVKRLEKRCLSSILFSTKPIYTLTYIDNWESGKSLTEIWNWAIQRSGSKYICLLNNDTEVIPGWLDKLIEVLDTNDKCFAVGPSTNNCHSPQKEIDTPEKARESVQVVEMKDPISAFCVLFRKDVFDKLGGFDLRYTLYGQESDLLDRAQRAGYKLYWRQDAFVWHVGESSIKAYGMDVSEEREKAKKLYWKERRK